MVQEISLSARRCERRRAAQDLRRRSDALSAHGDRGRDAAQADLPRSSDGSQVLVYKDMGLVSQVFSDTMLDSLHGHIAIGHARYSTTGSSVWENAQPTFRTTATGHLALGHNGNLTNTHELAERLATLDTGELPLDNAVMATSDTDLIAALFAAHPGKTIEQAAMAELPALRGAFSLVFLDDHTLYAARDPQGIRPLSLGRLERGWVVASETAQAAQRSSRPSPAGGATPTG